MKKTKLLTLTMVALMFSSLFTACSDDDSDDTPNNPPSSNMPAPTQNLAELADTTENLDSFMVALRITGLDAELSGTTKYTVLAPNNAAFRTVLANSNATRLSQFNVNELTQILEYHILLGDVASSSLTEDSYGVSFNDRGITGENVVVEVDIDPTEGVIFNNNATVVTADIEATNGRIHTINSLIVPFNILGPIVFDERFDSLEVALTQPGFTYVQTVTANGSGPFTIFAPTNEAFVELLATNADWDNISDITPSTLQTVLEYHIISGDNFRAEDLTQGQSIETFNSSMLTVDLTNGPQLNTVNPNQGAIDIIGTNYQGANGVVHAINKVLL